MSLPDAVLADLLANAEHAQRASMPAMMVDPEAVAELVREVLSLRSDRETLRANLLRLSPPDAIRNENNVLRKNNERLAEHVKRLTEQRDNAQKAASTAQAAAERWKLQATGKTLEED